MFERAREPAYPITAELPKSGQIADSVLRRAIKRAELIVLATPLELASQAGFLTPQMQWGAKETWYDVKLQVDSILKGKLKRAKHPDLGALPATLTPSLAFGHLAKDEIVVQYPAVTARNSQWASAPPLVPGERAIFIFRRCYYCLPIAGISTGRGVYKANPLVAMGWASKLRVDEWDRVARLVGKKTTEMTEQREAEK
jgi:hypothetical protein